MNNTENLIDARRLGVGLGSTGVVFYLACILTMSTAPRDKAILFFNSLLHGIDVTPILREHVSFGEVLLGIVATFVLGWFAGVLIAGFYNWSVGRTRT